MDNLFPAYAGVIPGLCAPSLWRTPFPRIRGGDPEVQLGEIDLQDFSPHTRG